MSLSARRVLHPSCHITVQPRPRPPVITESTCRDEHVELAVSSVSQSSVEHALVNGAEQSLDQYVEIFSLFFILSSSAVTASQLLTSGSSFMI